MQALTHSQQLINEVLRGVPFALGYLDDILIFRKNNEKHLKHLRTVLDRLWAGDLKLRKKQMLLLQVQTALSRSFNSRKRYLPHT